MCSHFLPMLELYIMSRVQRAFTSLGKDCHHLIWLLLLSCYYCYRFHFTTATSTTIPCCWCFISCNSTQKSGQSNRGSWWNKEWVVMLIRSKASKVPDLQVWVFCHSGIVGSGSQAKSYLCITRSRLEYTYIRTQYSF